MPTSKELLPLSYADIVAAVSLLASGYKLPPAVQQLSAATQEKLLANPLTPVLLDHPTYTVQRELLLSLSDESYARNLYAYSKGLLRLSPAAWQFVARAGKPDYVNAATAERLGLIGDMDGAAVSNLYNHWIELQRFIGAASNAPALRGFASVRTAGR